MNFRFADKNIQGDSNTPIDKPIQFVCEKSTEGTPLTHSTSTTTKIHANNDTIPKDRATKALSSKQSELIEKYVLWLHQKILDGQGGEVIDKIANLRSVVENIIVNNSFLKEDSEKSKDTHIQDILAKSIPKTVKEAVDEVEEAPQNTIQNDDFVKTSSNDRYQRVQEYVLSIQKRILDGDFDVPTLRQGVLDILNSHILDDKALQKMVEKTQVNAQGEEYFLAQEQEQQEHSAQEMVHYPTLKPDVNSMRYKFIETHVLELQNRIFNNCPSVKDDIRNLRRDVEDIIRLYPFSLSSSEEDEDENEQEEQEEEQQDEQENVQKQDSIVQHEHVEQQEEDVVSQHDQQQEEDLYVVDTVCSILVEEVDHDKHQNLISCENEKQNEQCHEEKQGEEDTSQEHNQQQGDMCVLDPVSLQPSSILAEEALDLSDHVTDVSSESDIDVESNSSFSSSSCVAASFEESVHTPSYAQRSHDISSLLDIAVDTHSDTSSNRSLEFSLESLSPEEELVGEKNLTKLLHVDGVGAV